MKKKIVKSKLSLEKKVISPLDNKQLQFLAVVIGGVNSLEYKTRCCCDMVQQAE